MGASKKSIKLNRYKFSGKTKKSGINLWRFVFNGIENGTGIERMFFIELEMLNPALSPGVPVLGFEPRVNISEEDLQNVLAGTSSAKELKSEIFVIPSYIAVKAGILGMPAKQICSYYSMKNIKISNHGFDLQAGNCLFTNERLLGSITFINSGLNAHPEYLCDEGKISWDLKYSIHFEFIKGYKGKDYSWYPTGAITAFSGNILIDGREYSVIPQKSLGYIDRNLGVSLPENWFHLSASNLTSLITGKTLHSSCFAAQGIYNGRLSLMVNFEQEQFIFPANSSRRSFDVIWDCAQAPEDEEGEKLHWSLSISNKSCVIDLDIFCITNHLYLKTIELPEGNRKVLKLLCGATGTGEIRLYKKIKKNLELIEHAHIANALCEFGRPEEAEK